MVPLGVRFWSVLKQIADRIAAGETVTFRPTGNSMVPLIHSRDEVVVAPVDPSLVEVGDIVLTRVSGSVCIHLVKAVDSGRRRVLIGKSRGGTNGWTGLRHRHIGGWNRAVGGRAEGPWSLTTTRRTGARTDVFAKRAGHGKTPSKANPAPGGGGAATR